MTQKFSWLFVCLSVLLFTQCNLTKTKSIQHNNHIVDFQKNINAEITTFFKLLEKADSSKIDSAKVIPAYDELVKNVKIQIDSARKLKPIDKDSSFKLAAIKLFEFYQKMVEIDYARLVPLVIQPEVTIEEQEVVKSIQVKIKKEEQVPYQNFKKAQQAFAQRHQFKLNEN